MLFVTMFDYQSFVFGRRRVSMYKGPRVYNEHFHSFADAFFKMEALHDLQCVFTYFSLKHSNYYIRKITYSPLLNSHQ